MWQETTETERAAPSAQQIIDESIRLYVGGDLDAAATLLRQGLAPWPENAQLHFTLGNVLFRQREWSGAIHHYGEAARLRPQHPDTYLGLGYACYRAGRVDEAVAAWRATVRQSPSDALPHLSLAVGLHALGQKVEALHHLAWAQELDPRWEQRIAIDIRWTQDMVRKVRGLVEKVEQGGM